MYIGSLVAFVAFIIPCAVAKNTQTLLVARFFNGFAGSTFLSVAGGTVGDLFSADKLSAPMMLYTLSPLYEFVASPDLFPSKTDNFLVSDHSLVLF